MKKILEFNYPEDSEIFELHNKGPQAIWFISGLYSKLRYDSSHRDDLSKDVLEYIENLITYLRDELDEEDLSSLVF